jgi:hypothetical protein
MLLVLEEVSGIQFQIQQQKLMIGGCVMYCTSVYLLSCFFLVVFFLKLCEWFDKKGY